MTTPLPGPFRPELDAAVAALGMQVSRETVLQARAALLAEADRLDDELKLVTSTPFADSMVCGGDPVSPEAASAFKDRIVLLLSQLHGYNTNLRAAALALDATARSYGYTDDDIASSFRVRE